MEKNKTGKYLKYAIGEILLVVIGILIALQVNNWNESRKLDAVELVLYTNLLSDIKIAYGTNESIKYRMMNYQDVNYQIYYESKGNSNFDPTMYYDYLQWSLPYKLNISEKYGAYVNNISNEKIRNALLEYISVEKGVKIASDQLIDFKKKQLRPFFSKYGIHNTEASFNERRYTFDGLMSGVMLDYSKLAERYGTVELDELLFDLRHNTSWVFHNLNWIEESNRRLQHVLKEEILMNSKKDNSEFLNPKKLYELLTEDKSTDEIIAIIKDEIDKDSIYDLSEEEINSFGYLLMGKERFKGALQIFKLNTELFPNSFNAFDSYGECLLLSGDRANAILAYRKSLELNPERRINNRIRELLGLEL
ncbi:MAG: hypothetical protein KJO77_09825 [Bacteroidia bacterium]|nr:hypothetical protein [Bacteroidia bacterium]